MDVALLARIQFAFTIGFHYIFPPLTIGVSWMLVWFQTKYLMTNQSIYKEISDFWIKLFGITFAIGVATGITMEFQFGTNWAEYSKFVGDIFGAPLAAEGIFAFFLESSFLGILIYGKDKVSKKVYWFSGLMVAVGSTLSAFWIIVANSWQQTPTGFEIINGRAELIDFWAAVFNPSTLPRYFHAVSGALIAGAFFVMGISAYYLIKNRHLEFAKKSLLQSMIFGAFVSILIMPIGHWHAVQVAETQPTKMAAFEGLWETGANAPLLLFGIPNEKEERTDFALEIPGGLSILVGGSTDTVVQGLKDTPKDERPPLLTTFFSFHSMVALGMYFSFITLLGLFLYTRDKLFTNKRFLKILFYSIPLPIISNELGWISAEVGRQPWIVQGILKTKDAVSLSVSAVEIILSLTLFVGVYSVLFVCWIYLLKTTINKGPSKS